MGVLNFIANSGTLALILAAVLKANRVNEEREWREREQQARERRRD